MNRLGDGLQNEDVANITSQTLVKVRLAVNTIGVELSQ
jgi:hypothetical protein